MNRPPVPATCNGCGRTIAATEDVFAIGGRVGWWCSECGLPGPRAISRPPCDCPPSFRYHADNCPTAASRVLNKTLHERCQRDESALDALRLHLTRRLTIEQAGENPE